MPRKKYIHNQSLYVYEIITYSNRKSAYTVTRNGFPYYCIISKLRLARSFTEIKD